MKTNTHFKSYFAQFFLEWKIFQIKVVEKIKTHILCPITFFRRPCRLWYNVENMVEPWRMGMAWWIPKATDAHSEYVILIDFPLQQWLYERASMLPYMYITCLVVYRPILSARNCSAHSLFIITSVYWGCRCAFVRACVRMHTHYTHALKSVYIMLLNLSMMPSLSIMHSLSGCAVG